MKKIRIAIVGVGNMGGTYASLISDGKIPEMELAALTRVSKDKKEKLRAVLESGIPIYENGAELFDAVERGELTLDAVIISTPHYSHLEMALRAFRNGIHVLCEKPSGVFSRQAREMEAASCAAPGLVFGLMFNQRALPVYQELYGLVHSGKYGALKRVNWVVTDWYRPNQYYASSSWHATWEKDGGGVILNQCPHNLDLLQWICGMPKRVQAFCHEGHYHDIEVEDDVTAYMEWENGATGVFVTSTGEAPGINRLEISLEEALIVCENGKIRVGELLPELGCKESEYRQKSTDFFTPIRGVWREITPTNPENTYLQMLQNFAKACTCEEPLIAPGTEGRKSLLLGNAIYLSSWEHRMVEIPKEGSEEEREFERSFEKWMYNVSARVV